ncbi:flagellar basal body-associated FliL family protein [Roseovarius sp. D22-M7]|uniref:flagellar basal body-associated FliL family protein n=1 Tax=Roseovarius sp. D22-M7 TaxID=3127116 RepID=UPI00301024DB
MAHAEDIDQPAEAGPGRSKAPWVIGLVLALVGGGGGFYAAVNGLLPFLASSEPASEDAAGDSDAPARDAFADLAFVPIEPLVISLAGDGQTRHLRFRAELEVQTDQKADITRLMPRIVDVLNTYLRALSIADLEDRAALLRLRAQMLRRVQIVTGQDGVNDLLIMEFVLN